MVEGPSITLEGGLGLCGVGLVRCCGGWEDVGWHLTDRLCSESPWGKERKPRVQGAGEEEGEEERRLGIGGEIRSCRPSSGTLQRPSALSSGGMSLPYGEVLWVGGSLEPRYTCSAFCQEAEAEEEGGGGRGRAGLRGCVGGILQEFSSNPRRSWVLRLYQLETWGSSDLHVASCPQLHPTHQPHPDPAAELQEWLVRGSF